MTDIEAAAALLRENGWVVMPPAAPELPRIEVGQVWVSPKPKVEPRTVLKIGRCHSYPWAGVRVVFFSAPKDPVQSYPRTLVDTDFAAWARKSDARPMT